MNYHGELQETLRFIISEILRSTVSEIKQFFDISAALFLEMWKRYSAEITHRWDLTGFDIQEEHPRPQYLARLTHIKKKTVNIVTKTLEPRPPFWRMRLPGLMISLSSVFLLVNVACYLWNLLS